MLKLEELKKMTAKELTEEFGKATKDWFKIKFEVSTGASKANNKIGELKRYRAQILTVQNQMAIEESSKFKTQKTVKASENK